jgi:hypothetical protein
MDGFMRRRRNTNGVLRVQQFFAVLEDIFFCNGVQMMNRDLRPDRFSALEHPVRDRVVFASQVAAVVPHDDPVPELPPLLRLIKRLVQPPVKPECVFPNFSVQLQILQPLFKCRQLA